MSDLYVTSGNGYHDWDRRLSVPPDDYRPAEPRRSEANKSLSSEASKSSNIYSALALMAVCPALGLLTLSGCGGLPGGPLCEKSSDPQHAPDPSAGEKAMDPNDPTTPLTYKEAQLKDGVAALWYFLGANCDYSIDHVKVIAHFPDGDQTFKPDSKGKIVINYTINAHNWPPDNFYYADLYYWDPDAMNGKNQLKMSFRLWPGDKQPDQTQSSSCDDPTPLQGGGISMPDSVKYNQTARITASPTECDLTNDNLKVSFLVNNKYYDAVSDGMYPFVLDYPCDQPGNIPVNAYAQDTLRNSRIIPLSYSTNTVNVARNEAYIDLYAHGMTNNGNLIARREIEVQAGYNSVIPAGNVDFAWEVKDPNGDNVTVQDTSQQRITFIPATDGSYSATLTVSGSDFYEPIVKGVNITVQKFSAPDIVKIFGTDNAQAGDAKNYKLQIDSNYRELGTEDDNAVCKWILSHLGPDNRPVYDFQDVVQIYSANSVTINFPADLLDNTSYLLQVSVDGDDDTYHVNSSLPITVYPISAQKPIADFGISAPDGQIPFRDINFSGLLINGSPAETYYYNYKIEDNLHNLLAVLSSQSPNNTYQFSKNGDYSVTLEIVPDGKTDPIATSTLPCYIFEFPKPNVEIAINGNNVVYAGKEVPLIAYMDQNRPEDRNATYAWKITHKGLNPATNRFEDVVDLDPSRPEAQKPFFLFNFNQSTTYTVELTVRGMNGGNEAYVQTTAKLLDVFSPWNGLPSATISSNLKYSYHQDETANDITGNSDDTGPGVKYNWTITDPDGQIFPFSTKTLPPFKFSKTGGYFFKLEVTGSDGVTNNFSYRSVEVYPADSFIPSVGISGPYSAHAGETVNLSGNSDDLTATYSWTITPPSGPVQTIEKRSLANFKLDQVGDWDFKLTVTKADGSTKNAKIHPISVYAPVITIPSAVISSNLKYSYHLGDLPVTNITGYSDNPAATYRWIITKPDGTIQTFDGQTIASFNFDRTGDYDFKLEVTAGDGVTKNYEIRSVSVYDAEVQAPQAGIIAPFAGKIGQPVNFVAANPNDALYTYSWDYNDGTTGTGSVPSPKTFTQAGTYTVMLIVARKDRPEVKDITTQKITIVPVAIDSPALSISAPSFASQTGSSYSVAVINPDSTDWNYSWIFGDGSAPQSGTSANHTYNTLGTYTIELTAISKSDPTTKYYLTQSVTVVPYPVPNVGIQGPLSAAVNTSASFIVPNPTGGATYSWEFGDNATGNGTAVSHTYTTRGTYQIKLTGNNNGSLNSITQNITIY